MHERISVISITLNKKSALFDDFSRHSAVKKIDLLSESIVYAYNKIQSNHPNTMVIITWQENGVCDSKSEMTDLKAKNYLHKKMKALVLQYPLLTVFAGTVTVKRPVKVSEKKSGTIEKKWSKVLTYYMHPKITKLHDIEVEENITKRLDKHRQQVIDIKADEKKSSEGFIISNTCYGYYSEEKAGERNAIVFKKRKMAPFDETSAEGEAFRPGSEKTSNPYVTLTHPISGRKFKVLVEICYEHNYLHLKEDASLSEKPFLQLIISDTVHKSISQLLAKNIVQSDAILAPSHINLDPNAKIELFQLDGLHKNAKLRGPLLPFYPIECRLANLLEATTLEFISIKNYLTRLSKLPSDKLEQGIAELSKKIPLFETTRPLWIRSILKKKDVSLFKDFISLNSYELEKQITHLQNIQAEFLDLTNSGESHEALAYLAKNIGKIEKTAFEGYIFFSDKTDFGQIPFIHVLAGTIKKLIADHSNDANSQILNTKENAPISNHKVTTRLISKL